MNKIWTHETALRDVAKGLKKAGLVNWANSCEQAADYIARLIAGSITKHNCGGCNSTPCICDELIQSHVDGGSEHG